MLHQPRLAEIIETILRAHPGINGTQIKKLAKAYGISKHKIDEALKEGPWKTQAGRGNEILYSVRDGPAEDTPAQAA